MTRKRIALAGIALGSAICAMVTNVHAAAPESPPPALAQYIAEARKADAIENDEARCKAYPDPPGNQWRPGAAQALCTLQRKPAWTLDQIDRLLVTPDGVAELERGFAALLKAHYDDPAQREQIFRAYSVFDNSPRAGEVSQRWLKLAPQSAFANTAAASHYGRAGRLARGDEAINKTPKDKIDRMMRLYEQAVPLYAAAMKAEPRLSVACVKLATIGRNASHDVQQAAMDQCLRVDPDSYYVVQEHIASAEPRWGGSDEQLRAAVAYAAARVERNPILGSLLGQYAGYGPLRSGDLSQVTGPMEAAARIAPDGWQLAYTGRGFRVKGDPWMAVVYLSQGTRFMPDKAEFWDELGWELYEKLGDKEWAQRDALRATELEPGTGRYAYKAGRIVRAISGEAASRPYFRRAMDDPEFRPYAAEMHCQTFVRTDAMAQDSRQCTLDLVKEFPESAEGWRLRSWVLYQTESPEALAATDRYIQLADHNDPFHREQVEKAKERKVWLEAQLGEQGKRADTGSSH